MKAKMPGESKPSLLLSREENDIVFRIIGQRCQSLATAVVQLFTTEGPAHNQWLKRDTGILCLIKDNVKRSYYFRIYCMQRKAMIWEHEVYTQIEYKSPRPFLHTFEAEDYMAAFNFANEDEAMILKNHLIDKIELRKQRREERRQKSTQQSATSRGSSVSSSSRPPSGISVSSNAAAAHPHHHHHHHGRSPAPAPASPAPASAQPAVHHHNGSSTREVPMPHKSSASSGYNMSKSANNKKSRSRKLTKADIGLPQDFKHVSHVGWDANRGFDIDNLPEKDMKDFFLRAGVSESQLSDKDTREFIYDFISSHGGVDAVKEALVEEDDVAPVPPRAVPKGGRVQMLPPVPARTPAALPAQPPMAASVGPRLAPAPPAPPARALPPPPPPPAATPQRSTPAMQAPQASSIPPPPPPPPPQLAPLAPAPSSSLSAAPPSKPAVPDFRSALMESIRGGQSLKHIEVEKKPSNDDQGKRGDLLSEIRQGIELKSVTVNKNEENRNSVSQGLAGALARALEERSKAIRSDSSGSDDDTSDGEEWED